VACGAAGIVPSLSIPGGLLSFVILKSLTAVGRKLNLTRGLFAPFGLQVGSPPASHPAGASSLRQPCHCLPARRGAGEAGRTPPPRTAAGFISSDACVLRLVCWWLQENNVVQTFVSSCYGIAFSGGFGMWVPSKAADGRLAA